MRRTLFNVLALFTALDYFLIRSHDISLLYFFLFAMVFFGPFRVRALVLVRWP